MHFTLLISTYSSTMKAHKTFICRLATACIFSGYLSRYTQTGCEVTLRFDRRSTRSSTSSSILCNVRGWARNFHLPVLIQPSPLCLFVFLVFESKRQVLLATDATPISTRRTELFALSCLVQDLSL